jgi:glucans biosynthesis protein
LLPPGLHFAGLRVLYPLNAPAKQDEVAAFVGASYFRLLGAGQRYGASARGLAINTAEPGGEEFPRFTELWIEKPDKTADHLQLFALLNSPSVTGAYRFIIKPGESTKAEIEAHLFFRKEVKKIGLAPLTSMFLQGESRTRFIPDFRPEVHDSDGLDLQSSMGEWLWRPLINPGKEFQISRFAGKGAKGFGLLQRDRDFRDYQDLEARYDLRPSLWVEPLAGWEDGAIELVEIPTPNEFNDNIVAYWVPKEKLAAGSHHYCSYNLSALSTVTPDSQRLRVLATRINPPHDKAPLRFVIDFSGDPPSTLPANAAVSAKVQATQGEIRNLVVQKNEVAGGWRVFFDFVAAGNDPSELRLFLHIGGQVWSETWAYHYSNP